MSLLDDLLNIPLLLDLCESFPNVGGHDDSLQLLDLAPIQYFEYVVLARGDGVPSEDQLLEVPAVSSEWNAGYSRMISRLGN